MEFMDVVKNRYSCKKYSDKPVEKETILRILEAGRLAPTAKNLQECKTYVLQSEEALAKVDQVTPCRYGAPVVLAIGYEKDNIYTYPDGKRSSGIEDAAIVATHTILAAADAGVDSCWINCFEADRMAELLELPENIDLIMLMDLGYAAEGSGPLANHAKRKELSENVAWL